MTATFFAIDHQGAIMADMPELNVSNANAIRIERWLGFRPQQEETVDIPGGERPLVQFQVALLSAVLTGQSMGAYANALGDLCAAAARRGADVIAWG